jgi:hypothetical protein
MIELNEKDIISNVYYNRLTNLDRKRWIATELYRR